MKITIRKYFIVIAVMIGVVAAMSQVFFEVNNEEVIKARNEQRSARNERDSKRTQGMNILGEVYLMNVLPDSLNKEVFELVSEHKAVEIESEKLYQELNRLKESEKVRNFTSWNAFWGSMGNPIFLLITGIVFILLYLFRNSIDWKNLASCFIYLGLMYLFVASVYLIWGFSNSLEIHKVYYLTGLIFAGIFAALGLKYLLRYLFYFSHTGEEKYKKIIRLLFDQLLYNIPKKGFIREDKVREFTESNTDVISQVSKEVE